MCRRRLVGWLENTRVAGMRPTVRCLFCLRERSGSATKPNCLSSLWVWRRKRWDQGLEVA